MITGYDYLHELSPTLARKTPRLAFGDYPTRISQHLADDVELAVKHDELSDAVYGGNKARKLAYLLGQAIARDASAIATFGAAGSNHALASAIHARLLGLKPIVFLSRQSPTAYMAATLQAQQHLGSHIVYWGGNREQRLHVLRQTLGAQKRTWVIPMGGTSWHGALGFVAAACELRAQIHARQTPLPARIYLPLGTLGSAVGLAVGLAACGLNIDVHAVRVVDSALASQQRIESFGAKLIAMCQRLDPGFAANNWLSRIILRDGFVGPGYARSTPAAEQAIKFAHETLGLELETTYSGKAMAALLHDQSQGALTGKNVLFWNTYHGSPPQLAQTICEKSPLPNELKALLKKTF